jgi:hypothetical protein
MLSIILMFRHNERNRKAIKAFKKENTNKPDKEEGKMHSVGFYQNCKVYQQYIKDKTGIMIHKNALRHALFNISGEPLENRTEEEMDYIRDRLQEERPPQKEYNHDKTRWQLAVDKTRERNKKRDEKRRRNE